MMIMINVVAVGIILLIAILVLVRLSSKNVEISQTTCILSVCFTIATFLLFLGNRLLLVGLYIEVLLLSFSINEGNVHLDLNCAPEVRMYTLDYS